MRDTDLVSSAVWYLFSTSFTLEGPSSLGHLFFYFYSHLSPWPGVLLLIITLIIISIIALLTIYTPHSKVVSRRNEHLVHVVFRTYTIHHISLALLCASVHTQQCQACCLDNYCKAGVVFLTGIRVQNSN